MRFICIFLFCLTNTAHAGVYLCKDDNGKRIYSDSEHTCSNPDQIEIRPPVKTGTGKNTDNKSATTTPAPSTTNASDSTFHFTAAYGHADRIDGRLSRLEWKDVEPYPVMIKLPFSKLEKEAQLYVMNDDKNLYIALKFKLLTYVKRQSFFIRFNDRADNNDFYDDQDVIGMNPNPDRLKLLDQVRTSRPPCKRKDGRKVTPGYCSFSDEKIGGKVNGAGAYYSHRGTAIYEFRHPLKGSDKQNDIQIEPGQVLGMRMDLRLIADRAKYPGGYADNYIPRSGYLKVRLANKQSGQ